MAEILDMKARPAHNYIFYDNNLRFCYIRLMPIKIRNLFIHNKQEFLFLLKIFGLPMPYCKS
jgi:hypothetical protein